MHVGLRCRRRRIGRDHERSRQARVAHHVLQHVRPRLAPLLTERAKRLRDVRLGRIKLHDPLRHLCRLRAGEHTHVGRRHTKPLLRGARSGDVVGTRSPVIRIGLGALARCGRRRIKLLHILRRIGAVTK